MTAGVLGVCPVVVCAEGEGERGTIDFPGAEGRLLYLSLESEIAIQTFLSLLFLVYGRS